MLYNQIERSIMEEALIRGMRPDGIEAIARHQAIAADFMAQDYFFGKNVLDVGPGQCDFLDLAKKAGAETFGVDFCPAVVRLGQLRNHLMSQADLCAGWPYGAALFDGIYCFGGLNIFWFGEDGAALRRFLDGMTASLKPGGWLLIVPWNEIHANVSPEPARALTTEWLERSGLEVITAGPGQRERYLLTAEFNWRFPSVEIWWRPQAPSAVLECGRAAPSCG